MFRPRIDIGGGLFGKMAPSLKAQFSSEIPDYAAYAKAAAQVFADYFADKDVKPELLIEPGSAVVGDCMKFVGTVKTIKNVRGKWIATVLGSQKNISMTGINPPDRNVRLPIILLLVNEEKESAKVGFLVGWRFGRPRIYKNFELRALNQKSADTCLQIIKSMDEVIRVLSTENINVLKRISFSKKLHDNRVQQAEILYLRKLSSSYRMNQKEVVDERERFERLLKGTPEDEYPQDELDNVILEAVKNQYKNAKVSSKLLLLSTDIEDLQHYKDIHCYHTTLLVSPDLSNLPKVALSMLDGLEMFNVGLDIFVENVFYQQAFDGTSFEKEEPLDGWLKKVMEWNRLKSTMSPISSYYR